MDNAGSDRPQRRTALVGRELGRYDIQIAALSETRFADVGEIKEVGAGYTFFWSGRKSEERREAGVGFAIKTELVGKLSGLPKGINDRLMTLRLPLSGNKHATIVSAYAPTMTNPDEVKDKFYDDLDNVISATPRTDKLILLGDFNARVGTDHQTWEGVIGPEGVGKCNSNGLLLLRKCAEHDLLITNTVFRLPNRNKTSWSKGAALYEKKRICEAERKRRERKAKTNVPPSDSMTLTCSTCNRQFRARIGLVSHQRTHQHTSALFKK